MFSITTLGCGDDRSDDKTPTKQQTEQEKEKQKQEEKEKEKQQSADLIIKSVDDLNLAIDTMIETHCTCISDTPDEVTDCFRAMREPTIELSDCEETAAVCNADSYLGFQACQHDAYEKIIECLESCPASGDHSKCIDDFETDRNACIPLHTIELSKDFRKCDAGNTPTC